MQPQSSFPASGEDIVSIPDLAEYAKSTQTDLFDIFSICHNAYIIIIDNTDPQADNSRLYQSLED